MMPAYNAAEHIGKSLKCVLAQTYPNWEAIVVDDGSTDATPDVVREFMRLDSRVRLVSISHGGRGVARNEAIRHMTGDLVAMLDADDLCPEDRFEKQVSFLAEHPDVDGVSGQCISFSDERSIDRRHLMPWPTEPEVIAEGFRRRKMCFLNGAAMLRRSYFDRVGVFNVELKRGQDYDLYARGMRAGAKLAALDDVLLFYRQERRIPRRAYFIDSEMYKWYADYLLDGGEASLQTAWGTASARFYRTYLHVKYSYLYLKLAIRYGAFR